MIKIRNFPIYQLALHASAIFLIGSACTRDDLSKDFDMDHSNEINFGAYIEVNEETGLETRANTQVVDLLISRYNCDFYIYEKGFDNFQQEKSDFSIYKIPSGTSGTLGPKDENMKVLNWFSRGYKHDIWAWTNPFDSEYSPTVEEAQENLRVDFQGSPISEYNNSNRTWVDGSWENGSKLEQLIGAHAGPMTYNSNGTYVPLQFQHLVSKVFLYTFRLTDNVNNTTINSLKGNFIIYGLPETATLYTCPTDMNGVSQSPYVAFDKNWDYDQNQSVTYAVTRASNTHYWDDGSYTSKYLDCWYFPPEVDFSKLSFKIEIWEYNNTSKQWEISTTHGNHGSYYGDFKNVTFKRTPGDKYDNPKGGDQTILHAGEYLVLNIDVYEKGNPAIRGSIFDWNNYNREASDHIQNGIYSFQDYREFNAAMRSGDKNIFDEFYEVFGNGTTADDPEGEYPKYDSELGIFRLYEDIGDNSDYYRDEDRKASDLKVADGYILDGMGHIVNVTSPDIYIGNVRDVYLRYYWRNTDVFPNVDYEWIVYIDKMGQVWTVDPKTWVEKRTNYNVNNMKKNPIRIEIGNNGRLS